VLFLSTTSNPTDPIVIRNRKRPSSTPTSAKTARKAFGSGPTKDLPIPKFVDDYNHLMNQVNIADQLRATNLGNRPIRTRGWHALWNFLFHVTIVNSYLLLDYKSGSKFRIDLQAGLLERSSRLTNRKRKSYIAFPEPPELGSKGHKLESGHPLRYCSIYNQGPGPDRNRTVLGTISPSPRSTPAQKRRKTTFGCTPCGVLVCKAGGCFQSHCN
jgi:hypothetical protein